MIYVKKKLTKSFKINFGLWLSNVIEFNDFLTLIKSVFELKIIFKNWFGIYLLNKKFREVKRNLEKHM